MSTNIFLRGAIIAWNFLRLLCLAVVYIAKQICQKHLVPTDLAIRNDRVAIVTGGTRGIGLEVVRQLLSLKIRVVIGCRSPHSCFLIVQELLNEFPNGKVDVLELDVSSLKSVRKFVENFFEMNIPLNILINNAGVMFPPYSLSPDGYESQLATNYLGHFLLTHLLLPKLKESGKPGECSRIVNVSSCASFMGRIRFEDINSKEVYSPHGCYAQSKLAQIMHSISLQEKLEQFEGGCHVTINSVHPGVIKTNLYQYMLLTKIIPLKLMFKNAKEGSDTVFYAAVSKGIEGIGGKYYDNCTETKPPAFAMNLDFRQRLWKETCEMVNISG